MPHPYHTYRKTNSCDPVSHDSFFIYDVGYSDSKKFIVICWGNRSDQEILISLDSGKTFNKMNISACSHKHSTVYSFSGEYCSNIVLKIGSEKLKTSVNKYPSFEGKTVMSTMVKNEDNYITQWIDFHLSIGFDHFIIYDNCEAKGDKHSYHSIESSSNLPKLLKEYIKKGLVTLIRWPFPKRRVFNKRVGISGQATSQTHCLQIFRKCSWIALFDIDEYLCFRNKNIKNLKDLFSFLYKNNFMQKNSSTTFDKNNVAGFYFSSIQFVNAKSADDRGINFFKIPYREKKVSWQRRKFFINPSNCYNYSTHTPTRNKKHTHCLRIPNVPMPHEIRYKDHGEDQVAVINHYAFLNKTRGQSHSQLDLFDLDSYIQNML